jgi:hypothetical protein
MTRRLRTATIFASLLLGVALTGATAGAQAGDATEAGEPTAPEAPAVPEVEVLDRGATPRTDLRFEVPAGSTERLRMRTYARISQEVDGETRSGSTPNILFEIDATVDAVDVDGSFTVTYEYASIEVSDAAPESQAEATRKALEPLIGVTGVMVLTDKGAVVSNEVSTPAGLEPETTQLFDQLQSQASGLTVPFPDGPVGRGGRWRATTAVELSGIELRQSATYTVERVRGGRTTLSVELRQRAPRQEFTPPGTDQSIVLISSKGSGSGETVVAPSESVMPIGGRSDVRTRHRLRVDGDPVSQTASVSLFLNEDR